MARTKQATPLRRDPSSEYVQGVSGTPTRSARNLDKDLVNGGAANGVGNGEVLKSIVPVRKEAGVLQLIFAAGGIYGSL